jgi:hypothetical protein
VYQAPELLSRIDEHRWLILSAFAVAMIFQWIWLIDCVRVGRRDRAYSMPLFCTFFWFAHDTGCVARFNEWFNTYDHWYLKCFWLGLLTAAVLELIFFAQVLRYGRAELLPMLGQRAFAGVLVLGVVVSAVTWELLKELLGDPLYQASPALAMLSYPIFGAALMFRRRSAIGQSVTMWANFTAMTVCWFIASAIWFGGGFRSWQYLGAGVVAALGGAVMTYLVSSRSELFPRGPVVAAAPLAVTAAPRP